VDVEYGLWAVFARYIYVEGYLRPILLLLHSQLSIHSYPLLSLSPNHLNFTMSASKITVVIIGGSFAGAGIAQALLKDIPSVHIDLVNPATHLYFNVAAPRILAKPKFRPVDDVLVSLEKAFSSAPKGNFQLVQGLATSIDAKAKTVQVTRTGGQPLQLSYDYLVIASGSSTSASADAGAGYVPFKNASYSTSELKERIQSSQETIAAAKEIVVAGGGPVGVETMGEIAEAYPNKTLRLVSMTKTLLPMLKESAGRNAENGLKKFGVKISLGRTVTSTKYDEVSKKWSLTLDDGTTLHPDMYISAFGVVPNNSFIPPSLLTSDGWVKVDDKFRVIANDGSSASNIYALGDITHLTPRVFMKAAEQIPIAANNLKADILGYGKHPSYKPGTMTMMLVPLGGKGGTGQMGSLTAPSFMVSMIKAKDFFISKAATFIAAK